MQKTKSQTTTSGKPEKIVYSTTDGRQRFPDILQVSYGEKAVIGFDRYGRALGAVVPMEAVAMLAGNVDVDDDMKARISRAAQKLLLAVSADADAASLENLKADRASRTRDISVPPWKKAG